YTPACSTPKLDFTVHDNGSEAEWQCRAEPKQVVLKDIVENKVLTQLAQVLMEIKQISKDMQILKTQVAAITTEIGLERDASQKDFPVALPLMNEDQFEELETALKGTSVRQKM
ncbi:hypothetical protein AMECASPLE_037261, partial [Ameca splendens]